ncbi:MAG: [FeFe] hydrogenase H-cluster radical SAM maturase HydE [Bacteroidales bacterium]|nr:[FeFe] hydrogenase H-cluster radical SAM maturase HydE [Bacteroidales bacterium]
MIFRNILEKKPLEINDIVELLSSTEEEMDLLFEYARELRDQTVGNKIYLRATLYLSNICSKNCLFCGLRKENNAIERFSIEENEIESIAQKVITEKYQSLYIETGERQDSKFIDKIDRIVKSIKDESLTDIGITLACGEQKPETYSKWFKSGAHRYILNLETTNDFLYQHITPNDFDHNLDYRKRCLKSLLKIGYQVGSGIMTGIPYQTHEDIATDLKYLADSNIHKFIAGAYIENSSTPLYEENKYLLTQQERMLLSLKCIAIMRIMMPDIAIIPSSSILAMDKLGWQKAINAGANIILPNITPALETSKYDIYNSDNQVQSMSLENISLDQKRNPIAFGEWGDSLRYFAK